MRSNIPVINVYKKESIKPNFPIKDLLGVFDVDNIGQYDMLEIISRLVDESIFDNFIESFKEQTEKYNLNNPLEESTNLGPVGKLSAANTIREQISNAISNGAKNIIDETKFKIDNSDNCYVSPSALVNVNHTMEFMME